ncbi:helicase-related protein [Frigidibacter sp. ROC022]|uniref:helicase-related protein n=1 Tax=Frigidibacter sp. ROC022 TaxID=2971796 RepID=UPI00215A2568|nr:helicase-related protein [Frigidibacter sp. ROC022]MCR8723411.1 helicase-related protein [Frigidibacter sp. ROC022]
MPDGYLPDSGPNRGGPNGGGRITAVLGPTNTGKTHYAIERMLAHRTGVIGLPLRLLAREIYDRIVALRGPSVVALVTGEERIVPDRAAYWVSTVEAMPEMDPDFLAVDEIQLCADPERGHVFTDRLLNARGRHETLFLGAETMRPAIAALVPRVQFLKRERFSTLTYTGQKKISRTRPRSAIVGFSVENVYAIAELLRRQKGGAAVVMGALSPRTRNAQVELYQNGDVDYLVATDAIGMGLNLDIAHVGFSSTVKFDGRRMRHLAPTELAQIAGRAGRYMASGTFGVTGEASPLDEETVESIEQSRFLPLRRLVWRNGRLEFGSAQRLLASLEQHTSNEWLSRARDADDVLALKALSERPEVTDRLTHPQRVRLLWDVCRVPDFRSLSGTEHAHLLAQIFDFLSDRGRIPDDWLAVQVRRLDRPQGDIDTLSKRLAYIRTWTYVAQRAWVDDEKHWRGETRAVEDRLSDALHGALTQRFVDRRTSVLMRRLKDRESLVAEVNDKGEVTVEGEFVGRLEGFRFRIDKTGSPDEAKTVRQASEAALRPHFALKADRCYNAPDTEFDYTEQGGLMWGDTALGKLVAGPDPLSPGVEPFVDEEAGPEVAEKVRRRLQHFIDRKIASLFEPLLGLRKDETLTGLAKGFAFRLVEALGVLPRQQVAADVKALDQEARGALRKHGIRFGQYTIFMPALLKPAPTRLRLVLWSLARGLETFPESPPPGLVTIPNVEGTPEGSYTVSGYHRAGSRAIRIDMLERLADQIRGEDSRAGFEAKADMLSITGMTLDQFADLMTGLGYTAEKGERPKVKAVEKPREATAEEIQAAAEKRAAEEAAKLLAGDDAEVPPQAVVAAVTAAISEGDVPPAEAAPAEAATPAAESAAEEAPVPAEAAPEAETADPAATPPEAEAADPAAAPEAESAPVEMEVFYTFTWRPKPRGDRRPRRDNARQGQGDAGAGNRGPRKAGGGKPEGRFKGPKKGKGGKRDDRPKSFEARPPRHDKPIDPDNPFAVLAALKDKQ